MDSKISAHALVVWLGLVVLAVANGGFRQSVLIPWLGEQRGHVWSTLMLCAGIYGVCWLTLRWLGPSTPGDAWSIGLLWFCLTIGFEFLAGHYLFHTSWQKLFREYNLLQGRIWIFVLIATFFAPMTAYYFRA